MAESIDPNVMRRLRYTPLRDLLRGRISGRLDLRTRIAGSKLPTPAKELITRIVRRTRLWLPEKIAVANELIAHFADGLEAGETIEQLITSFGDERSAARLMARAKRRNRPMLWKIVVAFGQLLKIAVMLFLVSAGWYAIGTPTLRMNYVRLINEETAKTPIGERAWPVYREAVLAMGSVAAREAFTNTEVLNAEPGKADWPALLKWMDAHRDVVTLTRQGAQKPSLGFLLGPSGSSFDAALWPSLALPAKIEWDQPLIKLQFPYLGETRQLARILMADARIAQEQSDGSRVMADIDALLKMADQLQTGELIITDYMSIGIRAAAFEQINATLAASPQLLSDADLQTLAHRLAKPDVAAGWVTFRGERMFMYDAVQRMYTDNGAGDGRLTRQGLAFMASFQQHPDGHYDQKILLNAGAATPLLTSSRREILAKYDHWMDLAEANLHRPLRETNLSAIDDEMIALMHSPAAYLRYAPLPLLMPSVTGLQTITERCLGQRDGLLVGLALEAYRRGHGSYPKALDELTPLLLPSIPADRITGEPLHYRLINGKPVVYSVGADRDDDGGRMAKKNGRIDLWDACRWDVKAKDAVDGDWVLYPASKNAE